MKEELDVGGMEASLREIFPEKKKNPAALHQISVAIETMPLINFTPMYSNETSFQLFLPS